MTPAAYNDSLVGEQVKILKLADELQVSMDMMLPEDMDKLQKKLVSLLNKSEEKVKSTEPYKEDPALRDATLHFIEVYQRLAGKEYRDAMALSSKPDSSFTENDQARLDLLYKQIDRLSEDAIQNCRKAQETFAGKNAMKLIKDSVPG